LDFHKNTGILYFVFFEISYPAGLLHSPDLLRYRSVAVVHYSFTLDALHLRQMRQLHNLGLKQKICQFGLRKPQNRKQVYFQLDRKAG